MKGPETSYAAMMDAVLEAREAAKTRAVSPLRPSNAGTCARRIAHEYLAFKGIGPALKEERAPNVLRLLSLGHFVEEQAIGELKEIPGMAVRFSQQVVDFFKLSDGTNVEGSTDAVMWNETTRGVLDVKSVGDRWHNYRSSKWDGFIYQYSKMKSLVQFGENAFWAPDLDAFLLELGTDDSLYKNCVQVNGYACTPFLQARGVDHGSILRYNKNNSKLMEIRFAPSFNLFKEMQDKFNSVIKVAETGDINHAKKERVLGSLDCAYCPAKDACWPQAGKKDFYKNTPREWAVRVKELEKGKDIAQLIKKREKLESSSEELKRVDNELILLMEGHEVQKIKLDNGDVYEVKYLQKGAEFRRGKE